MADQTEDAVSGDAVLALERAHGAVGGDTEYPVFLAGVEAERVQTCLESGDVVSPHGRMLLVEVSIAQVPGGLDDLAPCVGADDPVDEDASVLLERAYRGGCARSEEPGFVVDLVPERAQSRLDVGYLERTLAHTDQVVHPASDTDFL